MEKFARLCELTSSNPKDYCEPLKMGSKLTQNLVLLFGYVMFKVGLPPKYHSIVTIRVWTIRQDSRNTYISID